MRRSRPQAGAAARSQGGVALWLVYLAWAMLLFDFHFFMGIVIAGPLQKVATLIFLALIAMVALQGPAILGTMKSWVWFPPFLVMIVAMVASMPLAINLALARTCLQYFVIYYVVTVATALYVKTPQQAMPILGMLVWRFAWWLIWTRPGNHFGEPGMGVTWHPTMSNFDGFGGLMVHGAALCYWFGTAATSKKTKIALFLLAGYCVAGVIGSYARGAFLALVCVVGLVWLRSPRKMVTGMYLVGAGIVGLIAATVMFGGGAFIEEIMSAFEEGTESGTGQQRLMLWKAASLVWMEHPVFGVGAGNWGAFASLFFKPGQIEGFDNPAAFWEFNTHNAYVQILAELGVVGLGAFIWAMLDFFKRNRDLKKPEAIARWNASGMGKRMDLKYIALGLEGSMVATILVNMVYASLFEPWFVALWAVNRVLWGLTAGAATSDSPARGRRSLQRPPMARHPPG